MERYTKTTTGFVTQTFEKRGDIFVCTGQEFIARDEVEYNDPENYGEPISPDEIGFEKEPYQLFEMADPANARVCYDSKVPVKIVEWIRDGNDELSATSIQTIQDLYEFAGVELDNACSHDILGEVIFRADDGETYVMTIEAIVDKINPEYLKDLEEEDNSGTGNGTDSVERDQD